MAPGLPQDLHGKRSQLRQLRAGHRLTRGYAGTSHALSSDMSFQKILCPVDFSEGAREAMRVAAALARSSQASLELVHVWQPPLWMTDYGIQLPSDALLESQRVEEGKLADCRADALQLGAPEVATRLLRGVPWDQIVSAARDDATIDLIVMGTHGRTGLSRALIGSVAERVVRQAPCAVMVIPLRRPDR